MTTEIDIKLDIAPECVETLLAMAPFSVTPQALVERTIHFDTPARALFAAGISLRIREAGGHHTQTVQAAGPGNGPFPRQEWEMPVAGNRPVLDGFAALFSGAGAELSEILPLFEIRNHRLLWTVFEDGARIEAALDRGLIVAGERQAPVCEIVLTLREGDAAALFALARRIAARVSLRIAAVSKTGRGFGLTQAQPACAKAEPVALSPKTAVADSFRAIAQNCFSQFRINEDILLHRRHAEALHQARVGLRRLRSAFTLYRHRLAGPESLRLKEELRWLAGALGAVRDLDVLMRRARHEPLRARLRDLRMQRYDALIDILKSARARTLGLDLQAWLHCDPDLAVGSGQEETVTDFAAAVLDASRRKLRKHGEALADLDDLHRHEARKDAKKLRYAAEFFASLFADKRGQRRRRDFTEAMEGLQDHLGALNDLVAGHALVNALGLETHPGVEDLVVTGDKAELIRFAQKSLDGVVDARRFWRAGSSISSKSA